MANRRGSSMGGGRSTGARTTSRPFAAPAGPVPRGVRRLPAEQQLAERTGQSHSGTRPLPVDQPLGGPGGGAEGPLGSAVGGALLSGALRVTPLVRAVVTVTGAVLHHRGALPGA